MADNSNYDTEGSTHFTGFNETEKQFKVGTGGMYDAPLSKEFSEGMKGNQEWGTPDSDKSKTSKMNGSF